MRRVFIGRKKELAFLERLYNTNELQCVWNKTKVDVALLKQLQQQYLDLQGRENFYVVFARRGFTDRALAYAAKISNLRLISLFYLK